MSRLERRLWLDLMTSRYLKAIEEEDFDMQAELWSIAAQDTELEAEFDQVHEDILSEQEANFASNVADAVAKHLKAPELKTQPGPLTVADVARELFHNTPGGLSAQAHELNHKLQSVLEELPASMGLSEFIAWAEARFGKADRSYWKAFQDAARRLRVPQNPEFHLAARQDKPKGNS